MDTSRFDRVGPIAGVVSVVCTVVSILLTMPDSPDFLDDAETITSWYADDPGKLVAGYLIDAVGTMLLVVFAAALYVRLGGVRRGVLPPAAFGGAIAMCAMFMVYDAIHLALSWRADEDGSVVEGAVALNDLSFFAIGLGATMFAAVFVACAGLSALSSGMLPRWLAYASFVLALGLLIVPIAYIFLGLLLLWVLAISVLMLRDRSPAAAAAP